MINNGPAMNGLIEHEAPQAKMPTMLVAFAGWPDAAEAATRAMRFLVRKLRATKFAEIDPEDFYDFTHVRPQSRVNRRGERVTRWPQNDLFYYTPEDESRALLLFVGTEPNLKWRTYSSILTAVAQRHDVRLIVSLGALLDAVPHTREPRVTGRASSIELTQKAEWLGIKNSGYQGPTGIHTAFSDACTEVGMAQASIWGHCPHYVNTSPDPKVSHALLTRLRSLIDIDVDLEELHIAGNAYQDEVDKVIAKQPDVSNYVRRLERRYDEAQTATEDIPSPETMVEELENFLRSQNQGTDNEGS
ncbi:MAG: PAC2 family protein [Chloroflexi bacterium]|nr:PAC2 family protein [Chloroflexota bacterium]